MGQKRKNTDEDEEKKGPSLEDFVVHEKIKAFIDAYMPTDTERLASEVFDDARLRTFFKAYPCSLGDPLTIILSYLTAAGFQMRVSDNGEPAIFVINKESGLHLLESV